jgi:hypothetical protein
MACGIGSYLKDVYSVKQDDSFSISFTETSYVEDCGIILTYDTGIIVQTIDWTVTTSESKACLIFPQPLSDEYYESGTIVGTYDTIIQVKGSALTGMLFAHNQNTNYVFQINLSTGVIDKRMFRKSDNLSDDATLSSTIIPSIEDNEFWAPQHYKTSTADWPNVGLNWRKYKINGADPSSDSVTCVATGKMGKMRNADGDLDPAYIGNPYINLPGGYHRRITGGVERSQVGQAGHAKVFFHIQNKYGFESTPSVIHMNKKNPGLGDNADNAWQSTNGYWTNDIKDGCISGSSTPENAPHCSDVGIVAHPNGVHEATVFNDEYTNKLGYSTSRNCAIGITPGVEYWKDVNGVNTFIGWKSLYIWQGSVLLQEYEANANQPPEFMVGGGAGNMTNNAGYVSGSWSTQWGAIFDPQLYIESAAEPHWFDCGMFGVSRGHRVKTGGVMTRSQYSDGTWVYNVTTAGETISITEPVLCVGNTIAATIGAGALGYFDNEEHNMDVNSASNNTKFAFYRLASNSSMRYSLQQSAPANVSSAYPTITEPQDRKVIVSVFERINDCVNHKRTTLFMLDWGGDISLTDPPFNHDTYYNALDDSSTGSKTLNSSMTELQTEKRIIAFASGATSTGDIKYTVYIWPKHQTDKWELSKIEVNNGVWDDLPTVISANNQYVAS